MSDFIKHIEESYTFKGESITIGAGILNGVPQKNALVKIPLKSLNRHGLIAGATGTGKTKTLQVIAEQLSLKGVPVVLMDLKGDLSGIAAEGVSNTAVEQRYSCLGESFSAQGFPVELMSLTGESGVQLRATVSEFGPVLISKILELNDTQSGIISILFKYSDDKGLPLIDLKDLRKMLQFSIGEGKEEFEGDYGKISSSSVSTILRKVLEIEQQGGEKFFGERSFDVKDFMRFDTNGKGYINIIRLSDIQDKSKLFSTFMLSLLAEVYASFPEIGDPEKPKLCLFIDEAHLIFNEASKELLQQLESIVKLIRSKGVGIFFCTQSPTDIPDDVLGQLGLKVQHALRAFTAKDRKAIQKAAENYPDSAFYNTSETLTSLGIGEAFVTTLNEKGMPTPLVATLLRPTQSRMGVLNDLEIKELLADSLLFAKYQPVVDRESAYEMLSKKMESARKPMEEKVVDKNRSPKKASTKEENVLESLSKNTMVRQVGRTLARELFRGLLGVLGASKGRK